MERIGEKLWAGASRICARGGRVLLSLTITVAILLSSMHHGICGASRSLVPGPYVAASVENFAPPVNDEQYLPGDCHCICHTTVAMKITLVSSGIEFCVANYCVTEDHLGRGLAQHPPFKPPRA